MTVVTISPKFQIVIPEPVRRALKLKPGQKVHVFTYNNRIEYIPAKGMKEFRGFLQAMDTEVERDDDRL